MIWGLSVAAAVLVGIVSWRGRTWRPAGVRRPPFFAPE